MKQPPENPFRQLIVLWLLLGALFLGIAVYSVVSPHLQSAPSPTPSVALTATPGPTAEATAQPQTFHGYSCSPDCSELESGYGYAKANKIGSRGDCPSGPAFTQSYTQGCWPTPTSTPLSRPSVSLRDRQAILVERHA